MRKVQPINGDCFVIVSHTYRNHLNENNHYERRLSSIDELQSMFRWQPEKAEALGYPGEYFDKRHFNPRVSNVKLAITVDGIGQIPLKDVFELAAFLDVHPDAAAKLRYSRQQPKFKNSNTSDS